MSNWVNWMTRFFTYLLLLPLAVALTACGLVDQDIRECEPSDFQLDYELDLVTNMTTEIETEVSLVADVAVTQAMKSYMDGVFTDFAHDVDLRFYDVAGDSTLLHQEAHVMDASQTSYTLSIPVREYMHLASANLDLNETLSLDYGENCHSARILQQVADTLPSHSAGVFTGRLPMRILEGRDQQFDMRLYMANSATALVIDTSGCNISDVKVFMSGFATSFDICDSLYHFDYTPVIRADKLSTAPTNAMAFAAVHFPSRQAEDTKVLIDVDDPFVEVNAGHTLWQYRVYVYLKDGTITENILGVRRVLHPGELKALVAWAHADGTVIPSDPTVTVMVTLDWTPGLVIPVDL